ncbi:MAG: RmlC-like cupin domain-containing protein [Monoraphidium minutum]|nr:MAG: RmlC-like cupin domain-containing protein [Monoraphidium minutum]
MAATTTRAVTKVVQGTKLMEGAGVQICRTVGTPALRNLDPFLMLDELKLPSNRASAGFPDHPHRGFETCSIMLSGRMEHADSMGNKGVIGPGGVQWMTAGRGVVHSEMPVVDEGNLHGFQLWINLPQKDKMCKPRYQDYQPRDIPTAAAGPIKMRNPGMLLDFTLAPGAKISEPVPAEWNAFCYVYGGSGAIGGRAVAREQAAVLGPGGTLEAEGPASGEPLSFLLIAGRPIGEPIVQHGPFVMNTQDEIHQAFNDYRNGMLQLAEDNPWDADEL